jgi:hypothetical protein
MNQLVCLFAKVSAMRKKYRVYLNAHVRYNVSFYKRNEAGGVPNMKRVPEVLKFLAN